MSESGFIRFNPTQIAEVASVILSKHTELKQNTETIRERSSALQQSWNSDRRADDYFNRFSELDVKGEELAALLQSFGTRLNQAAGVYTTGESDVKQGVETLPTEGVFRV